MKKYLHAIKFNFSRYITYPFELVTSLIDPAINIAFLSIFWSLAMGNSNTMNSREIFSYFLISGGLSVITMTDDTFLGRKIRKLVRRGEISNYLIKPVDLVLYVFATSIGENGIKYFWAIVSILVGIIVNPTLSFFSIFYFIIMFINAFFISLAFNLFEGGLSFIFTEVNGVKNALHHFTRILSGAIVPLTFFPDGIRKVVELTPFPYMLYGPVNALKTTIFDISVIKVILISTFWGIILNIFIQIFWQRALKSYDAVGI